MSFPRVRLWRAATAAFLAVSVTGCATSKSADPAQLRSIHEIALKGFSEPRLQVMAAGIPPIAVSSDNKFTEMMAQQRLGVESKAAVASALEKIGYKIAPNDSAGVDAVLNVTFETAMYSVDPAIAGGHAKPAILIKAQLTDARNGTSLFEREYFYSTETGTTGMTGWVRIQADPKYDFPDSNSLFANPRLAAEGLRGVAPALAATLADELKQ